MNINADTLINKTLLNTLSTAKDTLSTTATFGTELQRQLIDSLKSQEDQNTIQTDASLEEFKRQLSSMGALSFLQNYNLDKVQSLVENKKEELTDSLGLGATTQPPLSGDEKQSALETLDKLLSEYQKELFDTMGATTKAGDNNTVLSSLLQKM